MKRFKKSLVTLLVLVFVLSIMSTGFAASFSDVKDENVADAVARLTALNIINGYPDGTFRPENTITRAEFAKVVVNALGLGNAAQYAKGMTKFKDVTSTHWASGYIQVASDLGIVKGYPDGTFKPEANVTYAEAITMIMRALGYEPKATALGGYPGGYLAVAAEKGVTDDVNVVSNLGATRGDVAKMINNALEVPLMEQTSFGANPTWTENENKSLLKTKLSVTVIEEKQVNSYNEDDNKVTIDGTEYNVAAGLSFKGLEGAKVTAWKKDGKIIYVEVKSQIIYDTVKSIDATKKTVKLTFADKTYETVGNDVYDDVAVGAYGKFIIDDGKIVNATQLTAVTSPKLVKEVNTTKDKEYIRTYTTDSSVTATTKLNPSDYTFIKNNKVATLADIKAGDVVYIDTTNKVIVAYDLKVEGKLTAYKQNDYIKVNGTTYYTDAENFSTDNGDTYGAFDDDLFNTNVVALKGIKNKIVFVKGNVASTTTDFYGFALDKTSSLGEYKVKVLKDDGTIAVYNVKDKTQYEKLPEADKDLTKFFKFSLNANGVIESVTEYTAEPINGVTDAGNGYMKVGSTVYYVSNSVKVFNMEGSGVIDSVYTDNIAKPEDVDIVNWSDIVNAKNIDLDVIAYKETGDSEYKAIVITNGYSNLAGDLIAGFVKEAYKVSEDKYEAVIITSAGEKTYTFRTNIISNVEKLITYREKGVSEAVYNAEVTETDRVYDVDTSRLLIKLSGNAYKKVASDVLIVEKNADGDPEVISLSDLKVEVEAAGISGVSIKYYIDTGTEIIKAITIGY